MTQKLQQLAQVVAQADNLEELTRPILALLQRLSGLESTYLTRIDEAVGIQEILYSCNSGTLDISEQARIPWHDTLCRRALDEGRFLINDVPAHWSDSRSASELGLHTYVSVPVRKPDGEIFGTLCGASCDVVHVDQEIPDIMQLFSELIAHQITRESHPNQQLAIDTMHDPLTGLPNRRYLLEETRKMLSREARGGGALHVAFIDLDGFKKINDEHGHEAGDAFLIAVAERLQSTARASDFIARYGGDEFVVVVTSGHVSNATDECYQVVNRLQTALGGRYELPAGVIIEHTVPSIGCVSCSEENADIDELLARADAAMYEVKQARKSGT